VSAVILIPVKDQSRAKSRLSRLLGPEERAQLAWAMLEDLIAALSGVPWEIAMVTDSTRAAARAEELSWRVLWEHDQTSESASVDAASRILSREGAGQVLCLPADIPLIQSEDIDEFFKYPFTSCEAALAPSWDRKGTNALLRSPPTLFPSRFGPGSFMLHMAEARNAGARIRIIENPRLALDIDDPADVARFLDQGVPNHTSRTLLHLNLKKRLERNAVP
jgi:2-phospho-L-lactate guanylyltransferase